MSKNRMSKPIILIFFVVISMFVLTMAPFIGASFISPADILEMSSHDKDYAIFWQIRVPRALVAFLAGAIFALSGMVFQALFRNPLVSPFTLGVSAGASLGATIYIWLGLSFTVLGVAGISLFSFLGAILSIIFVWSLANIKKGTSISTMLLAGVAVSFFFASMIMFIQYMSGIVEAMKITRWLMGGFFVFGYEVFYDVLPFALIGLAVIWYLSHELNLFTTGEEIALSRGVNVQRTVTILFFLVSLMVGGVVAICGPIAFVGIIAPHICRLLIGSDHRYLTPATFLFGGLFLTMCDTLARTLVSPAEMPVGVITALLGGPFFLWLLINRSSEDSIF